MNKYINTWGLYPWFVEYGVEFLHPDEVGLFEPNNSKVFFCKDYIDGYLLLQSGTKEFRVKPNNYKLLGSPKYNFGEQVYMKGKELIGTIDEIQWHDKDKKHIFLLTFNGKRKTRRYYEEELSKVDK
ncbi:DUF6960 family protein [Paenibacillus sp. LHD-38]|uniref:DUF6960 family protein n=1 Tax=Paenibacillus sp. LHD-38 TaxID=3072143 RepID=UPI00280DEF4A|nr:hypothetical protein [Paenibacillus sp. LHD-38]MDQ8736403.1 hypothetical protein [Paenibacillus sp. LHD-38]